MPEEPNITRQQCNMRAYDIQYREMPEDTCWKENVEQLPVIKIRETERERKRKTETEIM